MVKITSLLVLSFSVLIFLIYRLLLLLCVKKRTNNGHTTWMYIMCKKQMGQLFLLLYLYTSDPNKVMIFILSEVLDLFSCMMWKDNKIIAFGVKTCSYRHEVHTLYLSRTFTLPTNLRHYCIAYKVAIPNLAQKQ